MSKHLQDWPVPEEAAREHSRELTRLIHRSIAENGGRISFARFMEMALYEPGRGYYSGGARKFGAEGDFTTAPEISPLFSACLARQCEQVFEAAGSATILELGAGTGVMACDILTDLNRRGSLPDQYLILETSADLKERQQRLLREKVPWYFGKIRWLEELPATPVDGVILANEVLDALPVNRIRIINGTIHELMVTDEGGAFHWQTGAADLDRLYRLESVLSDFLPALPEDYVTEFNPLLQPFIQALSDALKTGSILLIDYGYPRREYYHPQRCDGTLVCHYRHRRHADPFIYIGLQDITASVDFTLVAESAAASGLEVAGFATQAAFLIACGLDEIIAEYGAGDEKTLLRRSREAGQLILPGQMGEQFKAMALTRNLRDPLRGFGFTNHVHRL